MDLDKVALDLRDESAALLNKMIQEYALQREMLPDCLCITITVVTATEIVDVAIKAFDLHRVQ